MGSWDFIQAGTVIEFDELISPSIGLTNLAKPYHVHYHLSQPDMAGQNTALEYP